MHHRPINQSQVEVCLRVGALSSHNMQDHNNNRTRGHVAADSQAWDQVYLQQRYSVATSSALQLTTYARQDAAGIPTPTLDLLQQRLASGSASLQSRSHLVEGSLLIGF